MIFDIIAVIITVAVILLVIFGVLMLFGHTDRYGHPPDNTLEILKRGAWVVIRGLLVFVAMCVAFGGAGAILGHGLTTLHAWVF